MNLALFRVIHHTHSMCNKLIYTRCVMFTQHPIRVTPYFSSIQYKYLSMLQHQLSVGVKVVINKLQFFNAIFL
jgi:hypothetical protein